MHAYVFNFRNKKIKYKKYMEGQLIKKNTPLSPQLREDIC